MNRLGLFRREAKGIGAHRRTSRFESVAVHSTNDLIYQASLELIQKYDRRRVAKRTYQQTRRITEDAIER